MNRYGDIDYSFKKLPAVFGYRSAKLVSLEESLQPIQPQIHELLFYIRTAKRYCHFPSEHNLTRDESASIYIYTMEWGDESLYRILNKALRDENRQGLKVWFSYLKLFDSGLDKLPKIKGSVWRGVPLSIGKSFTANQLLTWWTVNSCTSSVNIIEQFLGNQKSCTLFMIEVLNGIKVSGYTAYEGEDEVILPIGTQLRVRSAPLKQPMDSYLVHLIETDDEEGNQQQHLASAMSNLQVKTIENEKKIKFNRWKQYAATVAGGYGEGKELHQLFYPYGIFIDKYHNIFIADWGNDRIVQWKQNQNQGRIVAGGNGQGWETDKLSRPTNVIIDIKDNSLIIADRENRRVIRWWNQNQQEILIDNIACSRLTKDKYGFIYISDDEKDEVRRWKMGEETQNKGKLIAGGNGQGDQLNQFNSPNFIFVDDEQSVYVSDLKNHRVMKWRNHANEGIIVAGGNGKGNYLNQLSSPQGICIDHFRQIYVADYGNHRIMRWCEGKEKGEIIIGGNGEGNQANQLSHPRGLSFDVEGNLYVVDSGNHRIERFDLIFG